MVIKHELDFSGASVRLDDLEQRIQAMHHSLGSNLAAIAQEILTLGKNLRL
jgi:hypothetical protein